MGEKASRRERKKEQTRCLIAETALRLFSERGFDSVTIAEVAEAADVSINTVFNHFPTKEDLFFGSHEATGTQLAQAAGSRQPGEPAVAFLRRILQERSAEFAGRGLYQRPDHAHWAVVRHVIMGSPALQVRAAQMARSAAFGAEEALAASLAQDVSAPSDDPSPRLIAGQILALYSALLMEAERRRRAGQSLDEIGAYFQTASEAALRLLEHGIGDYGAR